MSNQSPEFTDEYSEIESTKFGFPIRKVSLRDGINLNQNGFEELITPRMPNETVILKFPSELFNLRSWIAESNLKSIFGPETTYWSTCNHDLDFKLNGALKIQRIIDDSSRQVIEELVAQIFHNYESHYSINPKLGAVTPAMAYSDWAGSSLGQPNKSTYLLYENDQLIGHALVHNAPSRDDVLLAGIIESAEGNGYYTQFIKSLISETSHQLLISTQSTNIKVQRIWAKIGLKPDSQLSICHIENYN